MRTECRVSDLGVIIAEKATMGTKDVRGSEGGGLEGYVLRFSRLSSSAV